MAKRRPTTAPVEPIELTTEPETVHTPKKRATAKRMARTLPITRATADPGHPSPASSESAEEAACIAALIANEQVAAEGAPLAPGQTHQMKTGPAGTPVPVRKRFSSI